MVICKSEEALDLPPAYPDDDEYDVYLYMPSVSQRLIPTDNAPEIEVDNNPIVVPENSDDFLPPYRSPSSDVGVQTLEGDVEPEIESSCLRSLSPTMSFVSEFDFTEQDSEDVLKTAGYSELLRAGLVFKTRKIKRRLDCLREKFQQLLQLFNCFE